MSTRYYSASGAPLVYGEAATRANVESFWQAVTDLAAEHGFHLGAGLLECDEAGAVLDAPPIESANDQA